MNSTDKTLVRVRRNAIFGDTIGIYLAYRSEDGKTRVPEVMSLKEREPGMCDAMPTFELRPDTALRLMDELWHIGIRPTEGHGSTGQLAATEKHLNHVIRLLDQTLLDRQPQLQPTPAHREPLAVVLYKNPSGVSNLMLINEASQVTAAALHIQEVQYLRSPTDNEFNIVNAQIQP